METLDNLLKTASEFNVNIDTEVLGYYYYKTELMINIFGMIFELLFIGGLVLLVYLIIKAMKE